MSFFSLKLKKQTDNSYLIHIEKGLFKEIPNLLKKQKSRTCFSLIADTNVTKLYGKTLLMCLQKKNIKAHLISFPAGERHKNLSTVEKIIGQMLKFGIDRSGAVIALGGGVSGDLAGFVASIYMRGIPLFHIPTTLLAMVDSSIGGKTGVDLSSGKNLAGTFYQPKAVFIDPELLKTLPQKELENGMAEVIKYGVLGDEVLLRLAELKKNQILQKDERILERIITRCCKMKAKIIQDDERENGVRMTLNYGHTLGHAFEKLSNYTIGHGEAIAIGMLLINAVAVEKGLLDKEIHERIVKILVRYHLLDHLKDFTRKPKIIEQLWKIMLNDKKNKDGIVRFIVPRDIGDVFLCDSLKKSGFQKIFSSLKI